MKKMRYLSKIVFINSAHIRYAEVAVDGNIHFTGTQGVGKTTLLRAILFFYNCSKDKLGIRTQGQRSFDDFYIPSPSSYIVYEVERGENEHPFSIILFRHNNRAAFRFVDAPFSREWFIDELGDITSNHLMVRKRIESSGADCSNIIDRYSEYLDILYGNRHANIKNDLLKYYLLRSSQYDNIPRIIQNVFLNERVDADFIKNIIINSVTDDNGSGTFNLNYFRGKLSKFSDELKDISLWTELNKQGINETRVKADEIITTSRKIKTTQSAIREQCGMFNYAMRKAEKDIPKLRLSIQDKETKVQKIQRQLGDLKTKYDQDSRIIQDKKAKTEAKLDKAKEETKKYKEMGIDDMIAQQDKLPILRQDLRLKELLLSELTTEYQSIEKKYAARIERLELNKDTHLQSIKEAKLDDEGEFKKQKLNRASRKLKLEDEIKSKYQDQKDELSEKIETQRNKLADLAVQRVTASQSSPKSSEIAECTDFINKLKSEINNLKNTIQSEERDLQKIEHQFELKCQELETDAKLSINNIDTSIADLKAQREQKQETLDSFENSFCQWLDSNVPDWEHSIGKVVDETNILYAQNLNPQLTDTSCHSLYGVDIDLSEVDKEVRTPARLKEEIEGINREIETRNNEIIALRNETEQRIKSESKEKNREAKPIQDHISEMRQKIDVKSHLIKTKTLELESLKEEDARHRKEVDADFSTKINKVEAEIKDIEDSRTALDGKAKYELGQLRKRFKEEDDADETKFNARQAAREEDIVEYMKQYTSQLNQIKEEEAAELSGAGADCAMLEATRKEIQELESSIDRIDSYREKIAVYQEIKSTLLDKIPDFIKQMRDLEVELTKTERKYEEKYGDLNQKHKDASESLSSTQVALNNTLTARERGEGFAVSSSAPAELAEISPLATNLDCITIISNIQNLNGDIYGDKNNLKGVINEFRRKFSKNNTFSLPTVLDSDEDFCLYAESLEEFVVNNKINDLQQVASKMYTDVIYRAATDFSMLLGRESDIKRIVRDINNDFEKKTFAGVIRSMELRIRPSSMGIISKLKNITEFWNDHKFDLEGVNLFSSEDVDDINKESIKYLKSLSTMLDENSDLQELRLEQTFTLEFQIQENDNTTNWVENIRNIGSEGTDILVKALINILLISVFKGRAGQSVDFRLHCMMDEIGRLADENIQGILSFANERGIFIVNSSPKVHRPRSYRRLYILKKDEDANTEVYPILSSREAELIE